MTRRVTGATKSRFALTPLLVLLCGCGGEGAALSHSYRGHEHDADMQCFVRAYPEAVGTRLDDCVLCHREGPVPDGKGGTRTVNACDFCHHLTREKTALATSLNAFGGAYSRSGRDGDAFRAIEAGDSDGDGFSNLEEIRKGYFPGRSTSNPRKPPAPHVVLTLDDLKSLQSHRQLLLLNAHRQRCDRYATCRGVRFTDLLRSRGIDVAKIDGITVFAPDGYAKSYSRGQLTREYPAAVFHGGLDDAALGEGKGIVVYPESTPFGALEDGAAIPGKRYLLLAYERDAEPLSVAALDPERGRIRGEGPLRTIRPQERPSRPDRGSRHPMGDEYDFDEAKDHNAGDCVRGVTVIRVDPMPEEYEEFDALNASWRFLEQGTLVLYGYGVR
jgi:hypothetical protein